MEAFDGVSAGGSSKDKAAHDPTSLKSCPYQSPSPQLQAWLETEAQLQRVLQALAGLLDRLPALAKAAASTPVEADIEGKGPPRMPASASEACYVKQVLEAERLAAYLGPLMYVNSHRSLKSYDVLTPTLPDPTRRSPPA